MAGWFRSAFRFFLILFPAAVWGQANSNSALITDRLDTSLRIVSEIHIVGNSITKEHILTRELTFHKGDTLRLEEIPALLRRSEENLQNLSIFNSVHISYIDDKFNIQVYILVTERWYIFPLPIFEIAERNFNVWWKDKDFSRVVYGGVLTWNNFRGRNEFLAVSARLGYTQRIAFYYNIPYINRQQRAGLTVGYSYSRNHQAAYATEENQLLYYKNEILFAKKEVSAYTQYSYRKSLYQSHMWEASYHLVDVMDTVLLRNPDYLADGKTPQRYFTLRYFFKSDHRDLVVYPLKGYYLDVDISQNGLKFLDDDISIFSINPHVKKFWQLNRKFFFGTGLSGKISTGSHQPYYNSRSLGYGRDFLRGYEYYVIDGQQFVLLKTNLKFEILPKHELVAKFIPLRKFSTIPFAFYLNLYADAGYASDQQTNLPNPLNNEWQYSYGTGIDFVTYYDLVFRVEYSLNKLGESGFFIHFTAPI